MRIFCMCYCFVILKTREPVLWMSVLLIFLLFTHPTRHIFKFQNLSIKYSVVIITYILNLSKRIPTK